MNITVINDFMTEEHDNCLFEIYPYIDSPTELFGMYNTAIKKIDTIIKKLNNIKCLSYNKKTYIYRDTELSIVNSVQTIIGKTQLVSKICDNLIIISNVVTLKNENIPVINNYHDEKTEDVQIYTFNNINIELANCVVKVWFMLDIKNIHDIKKDLIKINNILME